ncbi:(Fe-S)-binding protein [Granulicella sp. WH15]|uniref:(Fe-S)-binding protein n=1 Tax=Granulicella sp. WH15 TaxID=2602070 RepID=UPI00136712E6|nr:(Fe-S)-binding protein [Granulicella sp. WH15]QHN02853.1 (Fe-S)-binding protein [Granulicella sp. WH15]
MRIALFVACYNDTLFPRTGIAVTSVLERLGHTVEFPMQQTCCGQMHYNTGYHNEALPLLRQFVETFRHAEAVCVPSASCVAMMREHYELMAQKENDEILLADVRALLPRIYEFSELLVDCLGLEDVGAYFPYKVTYHPSCHSLRMLHVADKPLRLLRKVKGLELIELANREQCCGFGGTFAVKNPDVSAAMLKEKTTAVEGTGASICAALDNSCLMQIWGGLHREGSPIRTMHLAEILAETEATQ